MMTKSKPPPSPLSVHLDTDIAAWLCRISKQDLRTISETVNFILRRVSEIPPSQDLETLTRALDKHNLRLRLEEKLP